MKFAPSVVDAGYSQSISIPLDLVSRYIFDFMPNINSLESPIFHQSDSGLGKIGSCSLRSRYGSEISVLRICPTADAEEHTQIAIALFQKIELLNATIDVVPGIVPCLQSCYLFEISFTEGLVSLTVSSIMFLEVCICIRGNP